MRPERVRRARSRLDPETKFANIALMRNGSEPSSRQQGVEDTGDGGPVKRSLTLNGHRTSVSLEPAFWRAAEKLADARGRSLSALVAEIDAARDDPTVSLSSRIRTHLLAAALAREI